MSQIFNTVYKAGRCWNGAHRDGGTIIHAVSETKPNGDWFSKALCGTVPGDRSYGWSPTNKKASCPKCLKKMQQILIQSGLDIKK